MRFRFLHAGILLTAAAPGVSFGACQAGSVQKAPSAPPASGARIIIVPRRLVAGAPATLAVLDVQGRLTPGVTLEFTGGARVTTDQTGRAGFTAPDTPGVVFVQFAGRPGKIATTVLPAPENPLTELRVTSYPRVAVISDRFEVTGSGFRGEADANHATVGGQPALILAASPVSLVILPGPELRTGATKFQLESSGQKTSELPITLVSLALSATSARLEAGERQKLSVEVQGSTERLVIEARNLAPELSELPRGNPLRMVTSGGEKNTAQFEVVGRKAGDFLVSIRLVPGVSGLPDIEAALRQLEAARQLAPPGDAATLDEVRTRLERDPQSYLKARNALERLLAAAPAERGEYGRVLESAWKILLNR
jgi:hypothetical protein